MKSISYLLSLLALAGCSEQQQQQAIAPTVVVITAEMSWGATLTELQKLKVGEKVNTTLTNSLEIPLDNGKLFQQKDGKITRLK